MKGIEEEGYLVPSQIIGEYEKPEIRKKKPNLPKNPGLFPLTEEGTYGPPPEYIRPLPGYTRRVRRPKVYAAYSVCRFPDIFPEKKSQNETGESKKTREVNGKTGILQGEPDICRRRKGTDQVVCNLSSDVSDLCLDVSRSQSLPLSYLSVQTVLEEEVLGELEEKTLEEEALEEGAEQKRCERYNSEYSDIRREEQYYKSNNMSVKENGENESEKEYFSNKNNLSETILLRKMSISSQQI